MIVTEFEWAGDGEVIRAVGCGGGVCGLGSSGNGGGNHRKRGNACASVEPSQASLSFAHSTNLSSNIQDVHSGGSRHGLKHGKCV